MKTIIRHVLPTLLIVTLLFLLFVYKRTGGSEIAERRLLIERQKPEMVVVGDSLVRAGIDVENLGYNAVRAYSNGSASAWWFLYTKNVLCQTEHKPRFVLYCFRDHFLTDPDFRTKGEYAKPLRTLSEEFSWDFIPQEAKERFDQRLLKTAAKLADVPILALRDVFDEERMDAGLLGAFQLQSLMVSSEALYDFQEQLPRSYLPAMLALLKERGIKPIFVRMKRRYTEESPALKSYIVDLKSYLAEEGALVIDFTREKRIEEKHYGPGDHLNPAGKSLFSELLAEELKGVDVGIFEVTDGLKGESLGI